MRLYHLKCHIVVLKRTVEQGPCQEGLVFGLRKGAGKRGLHDYQCYGCRFLVKSCYKVCQIHLAILLVFYSLGPYMRALGITHEGKRVWRL